ncbi:ComEC/Rec2 family competence protein [Brevundimonas sp. 2R-24]|uniref:ComEC/Rec2 family competence protein n=1 Tax=Peiella sedimenti TaxID=3061083 RepID=A0ABT8SIW3_9CAUL|nr:ComEC/Rec2 family competence protein [Caulobacteraceae bacterium XZ-24]
MTTDTGAFLGGDDGVASIAQGGRKPTPAWRSWIAAQVEAQADRWRLWTPVFLGLGCAAYFALKSEPPAWLAWAPVVVAAGALWAVRRWAPAAMWAAVLMLALSGGFLAAKLRQQAVDAPVAPEQAGAVTLEAWVLDVESPGTRGPRILVAPIRVSGLAAEATPERLRVNLTVPAPRPGTAIRLRGLLSPPPPPAAPHAYDFGRNAYFQSLGGTVIAFGRPQHVLGLAPPPLGLRAKMAVNAWRLRLAERVQGAMSPQAGSIAAAMVTGHEAWISEADEQAMRDSGLAHILSISGLHMAIVGGFAFFAARLAIAAWPWLALRIHGKKAAALFGAGAVGLYLVVSGGPPPAERAAIVAWVAFAAILLDRRAVSMNALALAALIVLLRRPESIVQPGFQMSFAATAALVALAEAWPARVREISAPWLIRAVQGAGAWIAGALAASFVAGLATGPFAMQHFNRVAVFGLGANLAVAPLSSFVMMPALALGSVLSGTLLGDLILAVAGWSVDAMLAIGHWTSRLPGAVRLVPSAPPLALPVAFLGILIICLWRGRLRWAGLPLALAVIWWPRPEPPNLWLADGGTNAVIRTAPGQAMAVRSRAGRFGADLWAKRMGLTLAEDSDAACRRFWCLREGRPSVAVWFGRRAPDAEALAQLCAAEVVAVRAVVPSLPPACERRLVLDAEDFRRGGAVELWRSGGGWAARWTRDAQGDRPWT